MAKEKTKKADVPNQGHKHLFGSTEKSDFILNMDGAGAQKMCGRFLMLTMAIVTALAIPAYFTQTVGEYVEDGVTHYLSDNFIFYSAAIVMLMGWLGFLVFNIARQKEQVDIKSNKLLLLPVIIMVLTLVGCITSWDKYVAFLGMLGRHEGFLTACACFGLFAVASAVSEDKRRIAVSDTVVGLGAFHAVVGILQYIPATSEAMHNFFEYIYVRPGITPYAEDEIYYDGGVSLVSGIYTKGRAATGFLITPHALAAVLAVAFGLACAGVAFDSSKKRKVLYSLAALPMAAAACFTETVTALVGMAAAAAVAFIVILFKAFKKDTGSKGALAGLIPIVCAGAIIGGLLTAGNVRQLDEPIIFTDCYILKSSGFPDRQVPSDTSDIYTYLFRDAQSLAYDHMLTGVGCDNGCLWENRSTDRFFNEFMDMAAQRGVITTALYVLFLVISLIKALKASAGFVKGKNSWIAAASLIAAAAYLAQAWINTTWVNSNYFLFIVLGFAWSFEIMGKTKETGKKKSK